MLKVGSKGTEALINPRRHDVKKLAFLLSFALVAVVAAAQEAKQAEPAKPAEEAAAVKTHEVQAEIVAVDAQAKTLTIKGEKENKTVPVDEKALAQIKDLKPGQKATLICRDNEKGEHVAVAGVKTAAKPTEK
jgi:hypothetical protein